MPDIALQSDWINKFKGDLDKLKQELEAKLPDIATTLALSAKALSERRIKDAGFGFIYTNPDYLKKRTKRGMQTKFVDLTFEGRMWSNMQVVSVENQGGKFMANLGGTTVEDQNKMNWNFERYGPFVEEALTDEDRDLLTQVGVDEVTQILEQFNP